MSVFRGTSASGTKASGGGVTDAAEPLIEIHRVPLQRMPDGPTVRLGKKPRRPMGNLLIMITAMIALNVANLAGFLAWKALTGVKALAAAQAPPRIAYAQAPLKIQTGCSAVLFVDLDEPRVNVGESASDLRYDSQCGTQPPTLSLGPGAAAGTQVSSTDIDAAGCQAAIRTSPLGPGAVVPVKKGLALCVLTASHPAHLALVEVTDVGATGMADMRATSWKVPG